MGDQMGSLLMEALLDSWTGSVKERILKDLVLDSI